MSATPPGGQANPAVTSDCGTALDHLRRLLQRQLELVQQGSLTAAVELFDQTDQCVREISIARRPGAPGAVGQAPASARELWQAIEGLYQELSVALTAQQTEVSAALNTIRQGKKVLKTYGSSLSSA